MALPVVDPRVRRTAVLLAVLLLAMAVLGVLASVSDRPVLRPFHLDRERRGAALLSAALLVLAAASVAKALHRDRSLDWRTSGLPLLLGFMALDEWFVLHERVEAVLDLDWQVLYAPIVLAGGFAWLNALRRWRTSLAGLLLVMGAVAWLASQTIEAWQWSFDTDVSRSESICYACFMVPEELLEAGGSACFLLAGVVVLRRPLPEPCSTGPRTPQRTGSGPPTRTSRRH